MKNQLVAAMFCPLVVRKDSQPANPSCMEASEDQALIEPAKPAKSKKRKYTGEGKSKSKKSRKQTQ